MEVRFLQAWGKWYGSNYHHVEKYDRTWESGYREVLSLHFINHRLILWSSYRPEEPNERR